MIGQIGLIELRIGLTELGIGLMELEIGLKINNARRTVLARVSDLVVESFLLLGLVERKESQLGTHSNFCRTLYVIS